MGKAPTTHSTSRMYLITFKDSYVCTYAQPKPIHMHISASLHTAQSTANDSHMQESASVVVSDREQNVKTSGRPQIAPYSAISLSGHPDT